MCMAETDNKVRIVSPQLGGQEAFVRSSVDICIFGGTLGGGKPLSVNELVLTPNGWKRNGDLQVGDLVSTPFGKPQRIEAVYPQGVQDIYVLETSDGRKVQCTLDHLWEVRTRKQVHKYRQHLSQKHFMVLTTRQILDEIENGKPLYIPTPHAQEFPEKQLPVDPYLLGVLIGDGCLTESNFCHCTGIKISNTESDILKRCYDAIKGERVAINTTCSTKTLYGKAAKTVRDAIAEYGLNTYSYNRFIPQEYLFGSIEQRRHLLAGLFDTDGCVGDKNRLSFSTTSERLKDDFVHLCRSLGYIATVKKDTRNKYTDGHVAYDISICTFDRIFSSRKHTERYEANEKKYDYKYHRTDDHVRVKSITYKCRGEALCIYLDYPDHLYIANDFLTTHNSYGAILANAEPSLDGNYRAVFFRRTLAELKTSGGIVDDFEDAFGDAVTITKSENPRITFKSSGAWIECRQIADENPNKVRETYKGSQWDAAFFEELTGYLFYTFNYLASRVRGKGKWSGKIRATTNPSKSHWVRKLLAWYIGPDGYVTPERSGIVRYVYLDGHTVDDYVWGDTKEEVYRKCKVSIDKKLAKLNDDSITYENLIKSFTFILGNLAENKALLANNPDYVGNVSGKEGDALLAGNWNVDLTNEADLPINMRMARNISENTPARNGLKYITVDLADTGTNSTVICAFDGFHCFDAQVLNVSTPKENAASIKRMAKKHDIADSHIIYDAQRAAYMIDYIPNAVGYYSFSPARGMGRREYKRRKDENYARLIDAINRGDFSMAPEVAEMVFERTKMGTVTFLQKFVDECSVIQWVEDSISGKKRLLGKKEMISKLGKGDSTDVCDAWHMLMSVYESFEIGGELEIGRRMADDEEFECGPETCDIYDDSTWA